MSSVPDNPGYLPPHELLVQSFAATCASLAARGNSEKHEGFGSHPSSNPTKSPVCHHDQYMLFPNILIVAAPPGWWLPYYWTLSTNKYIRREPYFYILHNRHPPRFLIRQEALRPRHIPTKDSTRLARQQAAGKVAG